MDVEKLKKYCLAYPGAEEKYSSEPANFLSYSVYGKKFAYFKTSEPEKWRFSIRVFPERFLELTDQPGVKPARYMARFHWVTIIKVGSFDEVYLKELITWSYNKAVGSLTKKLQAGLNA
jgi:predicted DNA-binding protein (MmcQ/YjbR family)